MKMYNVMDLKKSSFKSDIDSVAHLFYANCIINTYTCICMLLWYDFGNNRICIENLWHIKM